jgi:osmotically-inducible protein OsmY
MAIITISRGTYSGGMILAQCLSDQLGYRLLSREELLQTAAERYKATEDQLESALLHRPGFLEGGKLRKLHYVYFTQAELAQSVQSDNVVYHGQAGHLLLQGVPHHMRVRVVANLEYRVAAAMERSNLKRDKAIDLIKELDQERDEWVQWVYGMDRNDPQTYDITVNLEHISLDSACIMIAESVRRDFQTTPASQRVMDDLVLASQIRAKIGLEPSIHDDRIEVECEAGTVTLTGTVRSLRDADQVRELVRATPGVEHIESKMRMRWWSAPHNPGAGR